MRKQALVWSQKQKIKEGEEEEKKKKGFLRGIKRHQKRHPLRSSDNEKHHVTYLFNSQHQM